MLITLEADYFEMVKECLTHAESRIKALEELIAAGPDCYLSVIKIFKEAESIGAAEDDFKARFNLSNETFLALLKMPFSEITNPQGYLEYYKKAARHLSQIVDRPDDSL